MISKELLGEVLDVFVYEVDFIQNNKLYYKFTTMEGSGDYSADNINIYELANLCKEWAWNDTTLCGYNIELKSYKSYEDKKWFCLLMNEDIISDAETEYEAIFKSCQWILDNKGYKDDK